MNNLRINCAEIKPLLMGFVDNELDEKQRTLVQAHLSECPICREEFEKFSGLKKETSEMKFKQLPEIFWDEYWSHVYNKIERGIGWIFFSIGAIILLIYAGYMLFEEFFFNPAEPLILKIGVAAGSVGFVILFVSVLREKLMIRKVDKYRSIKR